MGEIILECCGKPESQCRCMTTQQTVKIKIIPSEYLSKLPRCPYRQDLQILCFEDNCGKVGCPIWNKESGMLAQAIEYSKEG